MSEISFAVEYSPEKLAEYAGGEPEYFGCSKDWLSEHGDGGQGCSLWI